MLLTGAVVECLVSEGVQLLQDLVHRLLLVLQLLQLAELGASSRGRCGGGGGGRGSSGPTGGEGSRGLQKGLLGHPGATHLSGEGQTLSLTPVIRHRLSLEEEERNGEQRGPMPNGQKQTRLLYSHPVDRLAVSATRKCCPKFDSKGE